MYNLGVILSSHAWPENVMVETSRSATTVEHDARKSDQKRFDAMILQCVKLSKTSKVKPVQNAGQHEVR